MLRRAEGIDAAEDELYGKDGRGDELPEEPCRRENRLKKPAQARQALEAEVAERHARKEQAQKKVEDAQDTAARQDGRPKNLAPGRRALMNRRRSRE